MERTLELLKALWGFIARQDWAGVKESLGWLHVLFTIAILGLIIVAAGFAIAWYVKKMLTRPVATLVATFIFLTAVMAVVEGIRSLPPRAKAPAPTAPRTTSAKNVNERGGITYARATTAPASPDKTIDGRVGFVPLVQNDTPDALEVTVTAGGSITFWPAPAGQALLACGPDGLKGDPEGMPGNAYCDRGQANRYPAPEQPRCSLVGRVGGRRIVFIGTQNTIRVPAGETLFVTSNDNEKEDNSGTWSLKVAVR